MKFLLLAQGDPVGKDLLKRLVAARYGSSPPALDTLRVTYKGRSRAALWRIPLWARVEATATYRFPLQFKWEFKIRLLGFLRSSFATSFDGQTVYHQRGFQVEQETDTALVESARRRAWSETVFFVSPLIANQEVRVEGLDGHAFLARLPGSPDDVAIVRLREDDSLAEIEVERVDPDDGQRKRQYLRPVGELAHVNGLILPQSVQRYWGDELFMELSPVAAELNPQLKDDEFVFVAEDPLA